MSDFNSGVHLIASYGGGEGKDEYRDRIVTCDVGVSLHSKNPLFMQYGDA